LDKKEVKKKMTREYNEMQKKMEEIKVKEYGLEEETEGLGEEEGNDKVEEEGEGNGESEEGRG
jgi:hypothetical protein